MIAVHKDQSIMENESCIFCSIGKKEIPSEFVYEDSEVFAIKDIHPQAPVHILIIPSEHISELSEEPPSTFNIFPKLVSVAVSIAKTLGVTNSGYRLVVNQSRDAGQVIAHLHLHLLAGHRLKPMG